MQWSSLNTTQKAMGKGVREMAEKLTVQCPYCNFMMVQVTECKDLVVVCPSCGASVKISATPEDAVIKIKKARIRRNGNGE